MIPCLILCLISVVTCLAAPLQSPKASANVTAPLPPVSLRGSMVIVPLFVPALAPPSGARVNLIWDPSPDASVVKYNVYFGPATGTYTNMVSVNAPTNALTVSGLGGGRKYYFAATAQDDLGAESSFSNEVIGYTTARLTIQSEVFAIYTSGIFGVTNDLMMATSLNSTNWTVVLTFTGNGSQVRYLHTNNLVRAFFKVQPR